MGFQFVWRCSKNSSMSFNEINRLSKEGTPFLFYTNFDATQIEIFKLSELNDHDIEFSFDDNYLPASHSNVLHVKEKNFQLYKNQFEKVIHHIKQGDTYLLNLTQESEVSTKASFKEIFNSANAPFKLRVKDQFICFSPERFVKISNNTIETFPMKGTIDTREENAYTSLLHSEKEIAEHVMVVDLLRNDLSIVATNTRVENFRYIHSIEAGDKKLYQASSHIAATLQNSWKNHLGDILEKLLPAGSITGTPKKKTVELIKEIESYNRGNFCGVFGYFDGETFDSAVMIRYLEKQNDKLLYKSGGGITIESNVENEYYELISKIYIP